MPSWPRSKHRAGAVDSVDYWVTMGDAIHEAHIRAILAKRSPDRPPRRLLRPASAPPSSAGVVLLHAHCRRSARTAGSASPIRRGRGRGAAAGRQPGAGGRGGFLRGQGPVDHRRVLEQLRHHLSLEAGRLLADRRPGVPGRGRQLLRGGPDGGRHRDRRGHRLLGAHGGDAAQRGHRPSRTAPSSQAATATDRAGRRRSSPTIRRTDAADLLAEANEALERRATRRSPCWRSPAPRTTSPSA